MSLNGWENLFRNIWETCDFRKDDWFVVVQLIWISKIKHIHKKTFLTYTWYVLTHGYLTLSLKTITYIQCCEHNTALHTFKVSILYYNIVEFNSCNRLSYSNAKSSSIYVPFFDIKLIFWIDVNEYLSRLYTHHRIDLEDVCSLTFTKWRRCSTNRWSASMYYFVSMLFVDLISRTLDE